ncbi:MAG: ABC transporter permease, partial [Paenibacillaceae bacterium]|nr:ABC transporter permease [Paenibacillaceae bacterium]
MATKTIDSSASSPSPKAGRGNRSAAVWIGRLVVFIVIIGLWELLSGTAFNSFWLSKPSLILARIIEMTANGDLWFHMSITLQESIVGLLIG